MENPSIEERLAVKDPKLIQLYSIATPNGIKVAACLEELVILKGEDFDFSYEPHSIDIRHGENRTREFAVLNPNQKIPVIVDTLDDGTKVRVFESGAILMHLAERFDELMPHNGVLRAEVIKWLFWGSATVSNHVKLFGFYYKYCPHALPYCVERYKKEVKSLLHILNKQLSHGKPFIVGGELTRKKSVNTRVNSPSYAPLVLFTITASGPGSTRCTRTTITPQR
jgi:GST-like protein